MASSRCTEAAQTRQNSRQSRQLRCELGLPGRACFSLVCCAAQVSLQSAVTNTAMASCFQECKVTVPIHLHPSRLENVRAGIDEQLSEFLMEYVRTR
jgi:hypothetical protein